MRLKAKTVGDSISLDEYNAYQYLLYHMNCWKEMVHLDMDTPYSAGDYADYLLIQPSFLINDKNDTYKIRYELTENSRLTIELSNYREIFNKEHMKFTCTIYYRGLFKDDEEERQPDYYDLKEWSYDESHITPTVEDEYEEKTIDCTLTGNKIYVPLWADDKPLFEKKTLIYRWIKLNISLGDTPYIDLKNGKANEPFEIIVNTVEELENIINYAPSDGTETTIRLDANVTYKPKNTLIISKGQKIKIIGGSGIYITNKIPNPATGERTYEVKNGTAVIDGGLCHRTFLVEYGAELELAYLTLQNNNCNKYKVYDKGKGGAILVEAIRKENGVQKYGILRCNRCIFRNNRAIYGGAIFSYHAGLFLDRCDFFDNYTSRNGGAVYYWAKDVRLKFPNRPAKKGTTITLQVRITDYMAQLIGEGEVEFYLVDGKTEKLLETKDVPHSGPDESFNYSSVPKHGSVKTVVTDNSTEVRYEVIVNKNTNLPVTVTNNNITTLKPYYNSDYNPAVLEDNEKKVWAVLKRKVGEDYIPYTTHEDKYYLDYSNVNAFKFITYLNEITELPYIPDNYLLKQYKTDDTNEVGYEVIIRGGKPVTTTNANGDTILKAYYDSSFNTVPLEDGESVTYAIFKKTINGTTVPYKTSGGRYYLDYSKPEVLNYITYYQDSENVEAKGIVNIEYEIPKDIKETKLKFIAVYRGGELYDNEVAVATVNIITPTKYTAKFAEEYKGAVGEEITITVKVTDSKGNLIKSPTGDFIVNDKKTVAQVDDAGNYYLKYKIEDEESGKIPISFELRKSDTYTCSKISSNILIGETKNKEEFPAETYITGLFVNTIDAQQESGKTTYVDKGITDTLVNGWVTAGITDVFVRCADYTNNRRKALLDTVLSKIQGKKVDGTQIRVHAVLNCFKNIDGSTSTKAWGDNNPSVESRRTFVKNQITSILKNTKVDGICFDYIRFNGASSDAINGNIAKANRHTYVKEALQQFVQEIDKVNDKIITSICVMPEKNSESYYGQKIDELAPIVDFIIPMAYKGNYSGTANNSAYKTPDYWIVDICNYMAEKAGTDGKDHVLCCIQTYTSDTDLEKKSSQGKTSEAFRTKSDMDTTFKLVATQSKVKGMVLFREKVIKEYPDTYKKQVGG